MDEGSPIISLNFTHPKKRASRACLNCRRRKVRCDAMKQGMPCTNCRLDKVLCTLANRGKKRARQPDTRKQEPKPIVDLNRMQASTLSVGPSSPQINPNPLGLPRFVKPISSRLTQEETSFLQRKGAFIVPEMKTLGPFIKAYIDYVYPYVPIIDLESLLCCLSQGDSECRISLFLVQTVLFISSTFVAEPPLKMAGYNDRNSARRTFFYRAKVLYDFDVEDDGLAILQGLLLLSFWHGTPDDAAGSWYWAGLSLTWALRLGLHQDHVSPDPKFDVRQRRLRRRIWWSLYIRDRLTALWMQRPAQIEDETFNIPPLTIEDFDPPISSPLSLRFMKDSSYLSNPLIQRQLAAIIIDLGSLCVCIGRVLVAKFRTSRSNHFLPVVLCSPKPSSIADSGYEWSVEGGVSELKQWLQLREARYMLRIAPGEAGIVTTQRLLVRMLHAATLINLYLSDITDQPIREGIQVHVSHQAATVTQTMWDLSQRKLLQYLPITAVSILTATIAVHVTDINSSDPETRTRGYWFLDKSLQCFGELNKVYSAATWANIFFEACTLRSSAILPFQALQRGQEYQPSQHMLNPIERSCGIHTDDSDDGYVDPSLLVKNS